MEIILDCFFENFSQLERDALHARYKRRHMVTYFNTLIEGCCRGEECDPQKTCGEAVTSILRYHDLWMQENGGICKMGKSHNILYIAIKLCYDWQLKDTPTVATLLHKIYSCENTFERIWLGALFGIRAPFVIAGWKSDFENPEENLRAVIYYMDHARKAKIEIPLDNDDTLTRFIDIPFESLGRSTPLKVLVQLGIPDKLHILLRYGAQDTDHVNTFENLLDNLNSFKRKYPYNLVDCLDILLRAVPGIYLETHDDGDGPNRQKDIIINKYPNLIEDGIIPITRCGIRPPELKHLCRCSIRKTLWQNYQLPNGIRMLPVPEFMHKYLDLLIN